MNDDQLSRELSRRAASADAPDLLPAFSSAIDTRPTPVSVSRLAPVAGLAGLASVLLLLVIALPRLTPGPSATDAPAVLTTADFAARLATGELNGQTLLVSGRIEAEVRYGVLCRIEDMCYFGTLLGSQPPIDVVASAVPTVSDDPLAITSNGAEEWAWWRSFQPPVDGILLLSLHEESQVEFIGVSQQDEGQTTLEDARSIDVESLAVEDVFVVTAWLGGGNHVPCPPQTYDRTRIPGLPGSSCHKPSWLTGEPFVPTSQVSVPEAALLVQNLAYSQFAAEPTYDDQGIAQPRVGTYALARRLQGWCDGANAPCWRWHIVARIDSGTSATEPTPTDLVTPSPTPVSPVEPTRLDCEGAPAAPDAGAVSIEDHTELVTGCFVEAADTVDEPVIGSTSEPPELTMTWIAPCTSDVHLTRLELWHRPPQGPPYDPMWFKPRFLLMANRLDPTDPTEGCRPAISGRQVRLELEQPIDASDVELFFTHDGRGTDTAVISEGEHQFELSIEADKPDYLASEPIEVSGALLSVGDVTLSGNVGPMFGIEQLDGYIRHYPGPFVLICPSAVTLDGGVPRSRDFTHPQGAGPDGDSDEEYFVDGHLTLPAGTYRIFAMSSFSIGETCTTDHVTLEASTVIRVR